MLRSLFRENFWGVHVGSMLKVCLASWEFVQCMVSSRYIAVFKVLWNLVLFFMLSRFPSSVNREK